MKTGIVIAFLSAGVLLCGCLPPEQLAGDPNTGGPDGQGGVSTGSGPHVESGGFVIVEAEHYTRTAGDYADVFGVVITLNNVQWFTQQGGTQTGTQPDPDGFRSGASGDAYMELLPDRRVTHADSTPLGAFYEELGGATLEYEIQFATAGTYYVWARNYSSGTEDNGIHVSVNGNLDGNGMKLQWCHRDRWEWSSHQRDTGGSSCGLPRTVTISIPSPGLHTVVFHQREDGFDFDRFILTTSADYTPAGAGPVESPRLNP